MRRAGQFAPTLMTPLFPLDVPDDAGVPLPHSVVAMRFEDHDDFGDSAETSSLPRDAVALLALSGAWSARNRRDGFIPDGMLSRFCDDTEGSPKALEARGAWQRGDGGWQFIDWATRWYGAQAPVAAVAPGPALAVVPAAATPARQQEATGPRQAVRQALYRDKALRGALRARDGDRCRFCEAPVRWGAGRAPDAGTWELIDSDRPMEAGNIVTACTRCARARRQGSPPGVLPARPGYGNDGGGTVTRTVSPGQNRNENRPSRDDLTLTEPYISPGQSRSGVKSKSGAREGRDGSGQRRYGSGAGKRNEGRDGSGDGSGKRRPQPEMSGPLPGTPEFRIQVQAKMAGRDCPDVTDAEADAIGAEAYARARKPVHDLLGLTLTAIDREADPWRRWLSHRSAEPVLPGSSRLPDWCGGCSAPGYRWREDDQGRAYKCPDCGFPVSAFTWAVA